MPSEDDILDTRLHQLHPTSLLFSIGSVLRRFLIPGLIVVFLGRGERAEVWIIAFAVPASLYALFKYITLRYRFGESELIVKEGLLHRKERHIPYQRIQNIDTRRNIFHRLFGVADVQIQTASGSKPEAELSVLSMAAVDRMRRCVFEYKRGDTPIGNDSAPAYDSVSGESTSKADDSSGEAMPVRRGETDPDSSHRSESPASHIVAHNTIADLVKLGVISNRGMIFVAAASGILWQFNLMPSRTQWANAIESATGVAQWTHSIIALIALLGIIAAIIVLWLLSIAWSILTLYDFTLMRTGDELRTRFGLLTERAITIPQHRIQLIDISATLLHRAFHCVGVRARTAGAVAQEEASGIRDWLLPLLHLDGIKGLLEEVQPELEWGEIPWQRLPQRAKRRVFVRTLALLCIPSIGLTVWQWPLGALSFAVSVLWANIYSRVMFRYTRYALTPTAVWFWSGWFVRKLRVVRLSKIQTVTLMESPFDRRHNMVSLRIDTANSGRAQHAINIPYLAFDTARGIYKRLAAEAAGIEFKW